MSSGPAPVSTERIARILAGYGFVMAVAYWIFLYFIFGAFEGRFNIGQGLLGICTLGGPAFLAGSASAVIFIGRKNWRMAMVGAGVAVAIPLTLVVFYIVAGWLYFPDPVKFEKTWQTRAAAILHPGPEGFDCLAITESRVIEGNKLYFPRGWRFDPKGVFYCFIAPPPHADVARPFFMDFLSKYDCGDDYVRVREEKTVGVMVSIKLPDGSCIVGDGAAASEDEFNQFICSVKLTAQAQSLSPDRPGPAEATESPAADSPVSGTTTN